MTRTQGQVETIELDDDEEGEEGKNATKGKKRVRRNGTFEHTGRGDRSIDAFTD